ncbi:MAG: type I 3-dehydroquinate dehydratase [Methanobacteriaceae archaeon]|nr:type I 3-dehydroquinate dehydratase [Methanobacteriaceae archaeon]
MCASIIEETIPNIIKTINLAKKEKPNYLEIRLDKLKDITPIKTEQLLKTITNETKIPLIITNRIKKEGGYNTQSEKERIKILETSIPYAKLVDIEYQTPKEYQEKITKNIETIVSFHDFQKTPPKQELTKIIKESKKIGTIPKIATTPHTIKDTITTLELIEENKDIIAISMTEMGKYTRIIGPILGSYLTYAAVNKETAPGQLTIKETRNLIEKLGNINDT